jgi:hypothetical protein
MKVPGCPNGKRLVTYQGWVMRTYCASWNCPVCRKLLAHRWAQNVYYGWCLWRPRPFYFLTFTMPGWMVSPEQGYQELPACWDNLRREITKAYHWFVYAAFVEEQALNRDMPHLHVITLTNLPTRLNELALHCGFGHQAKNLLMTGKGAAYYVTKYASKQLLYAPRHFRRVRVSQVWPRLPDPILPGDYIPQGPGEKLKPYLQRCAAETGMMAGDLMDRWTNEALDIGAM